MALRKLTIRAEQDPPPLGIRITADGDAPGSGEPPPASSAGAPPAPAPAPGAPAPVPVTASAPPGSQYAGGAPAPSNTPPPPAAVTLDLAQVLAQIEAARAPTVVRREPSPYDPATVEGRNRSFFLDVRAAAVGDPEARGRVDKFRHQLSEYLITAADQSTAGSAPVIPPAWGGNWYVPEIDQMRPLVAAFSSAPITDPRPIPIPRFVDTSPAQLVAAHAEGVNPVPGNVNFDTVPMTPKGYSGTVDVTRELLDSSPGFIDSKVTSALRESYSQQTEMAFAAVLAASAFAGAAGGATAVELELAIRITLAYFPTSRFLRGQRVLTSATHWAALASANNPGDQRPLLPYVGYGPTNAAGVTEAAVGDGLIAGVPTVPAWAAAATSTFIRAAADDAMSWESTLLDFTYREVEGPAKVRFAVFGYFGGAVLQPLGVQVISSTAAPVAPGGAAAADSGSSSGSGSGSGSGRK